MRFNRKKFERARTVLERAERELTAGRTMAGSLWRQDVVALRYVFGLAERHLERPCLYCRFEFNHELLGPTGCPNCHGEGR